MPFLSHDERKPEKASHRLIERRALRVVLFKCNEEDTKVRKKKALNYRKTLPG
jgi:hypothetical protein